jgi:5-(aminomethyl)-3-furanmethanol phosphate kinase
MQSVPTSTIRVIKLGGSLLTWPRLQTALPQWLLSLPPARNLLIVGGGECIEAMRQLDALWQLDGEAMHWRCVRLLDATWEIAQELWPQWPPYPARNRTTPSLSQANTGLEDLTNHIAFASAGNHAYIVRVSSVYKFGNSTLPNSWDTTTDSIAAHLAQHLAATELILLKSASPEKEVTTLTAAHNSFVDKAFPLAAPTDCRIVSVQLNAPGWPTTDISQLK